MVITNHTPSPAPAPQSDELRERLVDAGLELLDRHGRPYAFMFEQPVPDFEPDPALRVEALDTTFGLLVAAVRRAIAEGALPDGDPVHSSVLVWCLAHGMVTLELTHAAGGPQPAGFPAGPPTLT
jgi:AcrR family transcriptional regulator